jgi:integrase
VIKKLIFWENMKNSKKILPSLGDLAQIREKVKQIPNKKGEYLRRVHYGCYLLCSESGLRISEAVKFDLSAKNKKGLYRINKCKGNKTRYAYVSKEIIQKLKINCWKPNQTNRINFYHFLQKIKKELNISREIELTPHTLRRCFTTYNALNGVPIPILQKVLGHANIRTTSFYWKGSVNIRKFGGWLESDSGSRKPEEVPKNKTDDNPQLPKR